MAGAQWLTYHQIVAQNNGIGACVKAQPLGSQGLELFLHSLGS